MRTVIDAERSLARYISTILEDYDVWTLRTLPDEQRPYAVVKPIQVPSIKNQSVQIIDVNQPFIVYMYPAIAATAVEGHVQKLLLEETLYQAFFVDSAQRVPMYDYTTSGPGGTSVSWDEPGPDQQAYSAVDVNGNPASYDYMRVSQYSVNSAQDSSDERRWSVTLTLRLAWRRHGKLISGVPVQTITTKPDPQPR